MDEDEFPDPDEEYDLVPTSEYQPSKNVIHETQSASPSVTPILSSNFNNNDPPSVRKIVSEDVSDEFPNSIEESEFTGVHVDGSSKDDQPSERGTSDKNKKRMFDELFGDIKDLLDEDISEFNEIHNDKRPRWNEPNKIIQAVHHERKKILEQFETEGENSTIQHRPRMGTISLRVPTWNFVAVTRDFDSMRLYVKVRPDSKSDSMKLRPTTGLLSIGYDQLREEAEKIILENSKRASLPITLSNTQQKKGDDELWVDKYRPKTYMELLSDETVNRDFLRWMKLWDKVVFHRELKPRKRPLATKLPYNRKQYGGKQSNSKFDLNKFSTNTMDFETVDNRGFPLHRIALISGPPGLGKTTLAHIVAKHAGYNVVDINASDDRGTDAFRQALISSTQMKSMIGADPRPNCLVLDEIDGAPAASIDVLLKFVQGKLQPKGKKVKDNSGKKSEFCKRPIVCICNEAYTPSLRPLRQVAYMVNVSKVSAANLTDRLMTIALRENIRVSQGTLLQLAERSGCDIRVCLGALQYMGKDFENIDANLGTKDTRKGLFESWRRILQVPMKRNGPLSIRERVQEILNSAYTDNSERIAMGVFENYPPNCHEKMDQISQSLEWFQFYDEITTTVMAKNDWRVMPYSNFAFVSWHLGFSGPKNPKLAFPQAPIEAQQKLSKNKAILSSAQKSCGRDANTIILDIAPLLFELLNPRLRAVAINLYSPKEKMELARLINIMLDLGLCFVQEKSEDGSVNYHIDPNLFEIGVFPDCKTRRGLFYTTKQIVSQELEVERLRRAARVTGIEIEKSENIEPKSSKDGNATGLSLTDVAEQNLQSTRANAVSGRVQSEDRGIRDFFRKFKLAPKPQQGAPEQTETCSAKAKRMLDEHGVWFKYNEGYSNAIRRRVKMSDLL